MSDEAALSTLVQRLPLLMAEVTHTSRHCIAATGVAVEVCKRLTIPAKPISVRIGYYNLKAWEEIEAGHPVERWDAGAWAVGIDERREPTSPIPQGWTGHVVTLFPAHQVLIDFNAGAFARPEHDLHTTVGAIPVPQHFLQGNKGFVAGTADVVATFVHVPHNDGWKAAPDWIERRERFRAVIDRLVYEIRDSTSTRSL